MSQIHKWFQRWVEKKWVERLGELQGPQGWPGPPGPTGMMGKQGDPGISPKELRILIADLGAISIKTAELLTIHEYRNLYKLIHTEDTENLMVAEAIIKEKLKEI